MALHTQFPLVQRYKTCCTTNTLSCALDDLPKTLEEKIVFMHDCRRVGQDNKLSRGGRRYNTSRHSAHVGKCDVISKTGSTQHIATPTDEDRVTATSSTHKQFLIKFGPVVSGDMLADRQTRSSQYSAPDESDENDDDDVLGTKGQLAVVGTDPVVHGSIQSVVNSSQLRLVSGPPTCFSVCVHIKQHRR